MKTIFIVTGIIEDDGVFDILCATPDDKLAQGVANDFANDYGEVRVTTIKVDYPFSSQFYEEETK